MFYILYELRVRSKQLYINTHIHTPTHTPIHTYTHIPPDTTIHAYSLSTFLMTSMGQSTITAQLHKLIKSALCFVNSTDNPVLSKQQHYRHGNNPVLEWLAESKSL